MNAKDPFGESVSDREKEGIGWRGEQRGASGTNRKTKEYTSESTG